MNFLINLVAGMGLRNAIFAGLIALVGGYAWLAPKVQYNKGWKDGQAAMKAALEQASAENRIENLEIATEILNEVSELDSDGLRDAAAEWLLGGE